MERIIPGTATNNGEHDKGATGDVVDDGCGNNDDGSDGAAADDDCDDGGR